MTSNTPEREEMTRVTIKAMSDTLQEIAEIVGLPEKEWGDPESLVHAVQELASRALPIGEEDLAKQIADLIRHYGKDWTVGTNEAYLVHPTNVAVQTARAILNRLMGE